MSVNSWAYDIGMQIYSLVSYELKSKLSNYDDLYITNKSKSTSSPQFPTIYIRELPSVETSRDLENDTINGIQITMQVEVTTNKDETELRKIMSVVADVFKKYHFNVVALLDIDDSGDVIKGIARFRRNKDKYDKLY